MPTLTRRVTQILALNAKGKYTQEEIAKKARVSPATVCRILQDHKDAPTKEPTVRGRQKAIGMLPEVFLNLEGEKCEKCGLIPTIWPCALCNARRSKPNGHKEYNTTGGPGGNRVWRKGFSIS